MNLHIHGHFWRLGYDEGVALQRANDIQVKRMGMAAKKREYEYGGQSEKVAKTVKSTKISAILEIPTKKAPEKAMKNIFLLNFYIIKIVPGENHAAVVGQTESTSSTNRIYYY
jgi:hypothetical protein